MTFFGQGDRRKNWINKKGNNKQVAIESGGCEKEMYRCELRDLYRRKIRVGLDVSKTKLISE